MNLSIADLHHIVGGRLRLGEMPPRDGAFTAIGPILTDSRAVNAGDTFWGLPGAKHDGSHFAEEALTRGACGVVTSGRWVAPWAGRWSLEVEDSDAALWRLAAWNCDHFSGRVITVEGALGKTITAAMISAALRVRLVGETIGNNDVSSSANHAAAALVGLPSHHDYLIVEHSSGWALHARPNGRLAHADVAVFVHSGGSSAAPTLSAAVDAAVIERLRLAVQNGGPVVVNGDDAWLRRVAQSAPNVVFIGRGAEAHVVADKIESSRGELRFSVADRRYCVAAWGRHHLTAALAAIAVGRLCGLSDAEIAEGLASFEPLDRRCQTADEAASEVLSRLQPGDALLLSGRPMAAIKQKIQQHQTAILRRAA